MTVFSLIAAAALIAAGPAKVQCRDGSSVAPSEGCKLHGGQEGERQQETSPSPARKSVPPNQRAEDRPAHESPYSTFGAPHARTERTGRHTGRRVHCSDGTTQASAKGACDAHGGTKD